MSAIFAPTLMPFPIIITIIFVIVVVITIIIKLSTANTGRSSEKSTKKTTSNNNNNNDIKTKGVFSLSDVAKHNTEDDCWIIVTLNGVTKV